MRRWLQEEGAVVRAGEPLLELEIRTILHATHESVVLRRIGVTLGEKPILPDNIPARHTDALNRAIHLRGDVVQFVAPEDGVLHKILCNSDDLLTAESQVAIMAKDRNTDEKCRSFNHQVHHSYFGKDATERLRQRRDTQRRFLHGEPDGTGVPCTQASLFHHFGDLTAPHRGDNPPHMKFSL